MALPHVFLTLRADYPKSIGQQNENWLLSHTCSKMAFSQSGEYSVVKHSVVRHVYNSEQFFGQRCTQGRNEGGSGAQFPGHLITMGAPNHCRGAEMPQQCHKYFLQYSEFASERAQVGTGERQTCFLSRAPSNLVIPLDVHSSWISVRPHGCKARSCGLRELARATLIRNRHRPGLTNRITQSFS